MRLNLNFSPRQPFFQKASAIPLILQAQVAIYGKPVSEITTEASIASAMATSVFPSVGITVPLLYYGQ